MKPLVYVIIATAFKRSQWVIERSLRSVYLQEGVDRKSIQIVIVDDNEGDVEIALINEGIKTLRESLNLSLNEFPTRVIKNSRTKHMSGTGAWNTGIILAHQESPDCIVSILDDDDEYTPDHIAACLEVTNNKQSIAAVFQELIWKWPDGNIWEFPLSLSDITPENFYKANPGIQGSNLFVKASMLIACGAFDESFESTTDRDLMIRLLWHLISIQPEKWQQTIALINKPSVIHYCHSMDRVTTNHSKKQNGLNRFYEKYKKHFTESDYQKSLKRASLLFKYPGCNPKEECIVLLMAMHNNMDTVEKALHSVLCQKATERPLYILVSDDNSTDESRNVVEQLSKSFPNIFLYSNQFNNVAQNRNWLQQKASELFHECVLIGRLDADDILADHDILQRIEALWDKTHFDVLLMANRQYVNNDFTGYINRPHEDLKQIPSLLERVKQMSDGVWEAELPSCNVFLKPQAAIPYSATKSAEDHRNLIDYLLCSDELSIHIKADWIYCNYSIDKHFNSTEQEKFRKQKARKDLYKYTQSEAEKILRKQKALKLLQKWKPGSYSYLGAGFAGVVFHDGQWVYKVHLPLSANNFNEVDNILFLKSKLELFSGRKHFYELRELTLVDDVYILVYPYEQSKPVENLTREDMVSFLAEMWQMKVLCRSITKGNNFVRVNGIIKLIDYEIETYNDNLFLNTAARAFIQLDEFSIQQISTFKLRRSTINNFTLPELEGFDDFVKEIFERCADLNMPEYGNEIKLNAKIEPSKYDGIENPSVALLIKACVQDSATLYNDVCFLVGQLTQATKFSNRYLLLDLYKEQNFTRQYTNFGNKEQLMEAAYRLKSDGFIDELIIPPDDFQSKENINESWFGVKSGNTHTIKGVPVTSQLYAFEQVSSDFILQMDVDVLIGFKKHNTDFLKGMIASLQKNPKALSIGVQIHQVDDLTFQPITGKDGAIAPDVRCSLIHKHRLIEARPFENQFTEKGWDLSWYRALERHQKAKGYVSLRGGTTDAFYIHPQNYRKVNRWVWHTLQKGVKYGNIPSLQQGQPEVAGNIFDWCLPKRNEELVVILYVDEPDMYSIQESLHTIVAQDAGNFGIILINNTGAEDLIQSCISQYVETHKRITVIHFEQQVAYNDAVYKAIHYYMTNQDSFICLMMQGDILLYGSVLSECLNRLQIYNADVLIGKEISKRTLPDTGMSRSNFLHPRHEPETLANGLSIFRKYLFDALSHLDMKTKVPDAPTHIPAFSKIKQTHIWLNDISNISILTPIVELSSNPIRFDHFNMLRTHNVLNVRIQEAISFVQNQTPKQEGAWEKGRKTFLPNTSKIELDITYDCNLKCFHCNRSCTQAPTDAHMTLQQVQQFVKESVDLDKQWELINLLGGEPTLHPQFAEIVHCLLYDYLIPHSPNTTLQVTSNGYGEEVQHKLAALPKHPNLVVDYNSFKDDRTVPYFTPFNLAPADESDALMHEYYKGCWVTAYCGIGLNHLGYFACGVAGGIERILKAGKGVNSLEELDDRLIQQLDTYCRLCGNFTAYAENRGDFMERAEKDSAPKTAMSKSWKKLYKQYNDENV